ncbi:isochorismate synthase MenF [Albirhodobacter sp. R86504]|uniref:isochorismate synthase n=1 Tax=Albirhodobacter sp. R86504 TaxID=3093848 RepID=UPI00366BE342
MNISLASPHAAARNQSQQRPFAFHGPEGSCIAQGPTTAVRRGTRETLESRINEAFATLPDPRRVSAQGRPSRGVIGGALPFDIDAQDCLWLAPQSIALPPNQDSPWPAPPAKNTATPINRTAPAHVAPEPPARDYARAVEQTLEIMRAQADLPDGLRKIVLARSLQISATTLFDRSVVLARLASDPAATAFETRLPDAQTDLLGDLRAGTLRDPRFLIGGTPELLIQKTGHAIFSHPLAGSARRDDDPARDQANAVALLASEKDRREHGLVVEYILDTLAPECLSLRCPQGIAITRTRSMWHLGTRIEGVLRDPDQPAVLLAAKLHPTPAVCGTPHDRAAALIHTLEPNDRGFYAGTVGWTDRSGDGAWYVAIRSAEICGAQARLYAGAGIVAGSDPMAEAVETGAKFGAMLAALDLPLTTGMIGLPFTNLKD